MTVLLFFLVKVEVKDGRVLVRGKNEVSCSGNCCFT